MTLILQEPIKLMIKFFKISFLLISLSVFILIVGLLFFKFYFSWRPFMDDGPFYGEMLKECPSDDMVSVFDVDGEFKIQVFTDKENLNPPIVSMKNAQGNVVWCLSAKGNEGAKVNDLKFISYKKNDNAFVVKGVVNWTFGDKRTLWYFDKSGRLINYYYSW